MGLRLFDNPLHLILLLVVVLIVFGAGKLPGVGAALGQSIKEFKKATNEPEDKAKDTAAANSCPQCHAIVPAGAQFCPACGAPARPQVAAAASAPETGATAFCSQCGAKNAADARFCAQCGSNMSVHAG
jgi:sec-independent protein translocase protein TatA